MTRAQFLQFAPNGEVEPVNEMSVHARAAVIASRMADTAADMRRSIEALQEELRRVYPQGIIVITMEEDTDATGGGEPELRGDYDGAGAGAD